MRMDPARIEPDSLAIRNTLIERIAKSPAGGVFHSAKTELTNRNSFVIQLDNDGPIFTVTVSYGGQFNAPVSR